MLYLNLKAGFDFESADYQNKSLENVANDCWSQYFTQYWQRRDSLAYRGILLKDSNTGNKGVSHYFISTQRGSTKTGCD